MLPHTTKRKTTTNLKTTNNQNYHKIELYGSLKTKGIKKKHSPRLVGGAETGSWLERTHGKAVAGGLWQLVDQGKQGGDWQSRWSHIHLWINREELLGRETDHMTQGSSVEK